ncbi:MAG: TonB family protein [Candidatus Omnitrophica bacterium]|nr:TonB family protein [Candidatus Omnitrophota bacterium]MCM8799616.1 TonB family protein [Candidatus Omnitrophota bacterium]
MKRIFFVIFILIIGSFIFAEEITEEITLYVGQIKTLPATTPTRIVIGRPEVADVTQVKENEIVLAAKSPGTTTFVFWDKFGEQAFRIRVFAEDLQEIKERIDTLIKELNLNKVYTKTLDTEAKVLLLGEVRTFQDKERLFTTLGALKEKTIDLIQIKEDKLVEIDVQVLELTKEASEVLGFSWPSNLTLTEQNYPTPTSASKWSTLFQVSYFSRTNFAWTLDLLQRERKLNILSRPRLVCLSGKEAELLVGGEVPTFTATISETGTTGTVEYKEYGIKLKIRPLVTEDNKIQLSLNTEVSELGTVEATAYARAYPRTIRSTSTELYLDDGQTVVISGLIKQKSDVTIRKFPWLAEIPILGIFFKRKEVPLDTPTQDTELFITLTPKIIKGKEPIPSYKEIPEAKIKPSISESLPPEIRSYIELVQNKIRSKLFYPSSAKEAGWWGTLRLSIVVDSKGELKDVKILESSGYKILDDAGQEAVHLSSPFPPFPTELKLKELAIEIPIVYHQE